MDWLMMKDRLVDGVKKYKYAILILFLGLALLMMPTQSTEEQRSSAPSETTIQSSEEMDDRLANILSQIKGAGKVQVMLTLKSGEEILYQTDQKMQSGENGYSQWNTVVITGSDRAENGLITQINPPVYQGAIIVCEGADKASVRLAVVEAVSKVTGLGADQISVLKMK